MLVALLAAVLGGVLVSISPCVLPVLPVVLTAGASDRTVDETRRRLTMRPVLVVVGLVISFCASTLLGSLVLSELGLPQDLLRDVGIAVLFVIGLSLLVPRLSELLERPFTRLAARRAGRPRGNGLLLGLGLGLVYVPCAGPILAAIAVAGATHHVGWRAVAVTAAFGIGVGIPLLAFALAGDAVTRRVAVARRRAHAVRLASGVIIVALAVAVSFDLPDVLQRHVPGWVSSLQQDVEGRPDVTHQLRLADGSAKPLTERKHPAADDAAGQNLGGECTQDGLQLEDCGAAPAISGIAGWLNTPHDTPLTLSGLRGKVVLLDFWTYSCINCQRTLPHVEAWYRTYAAAGLEVIGVHTPEFAFEHVRSNVKSQAASLGVKYPIAIDNDYGTWNAYGNEAWPADYLIDANGYVRHVGIGEGNYDQTEGLIRQLLHQAHPDASLPPSTGVAAAHVDDNSTTETYLGYEYGEGQQELHLTSGFSLVHDRTYRYRFPHNLDPDGFALDGQWTSRKQYVLAGSDARLELKWHALKAYLVLGGTGTVRVDVDGRYSSTVTVLGAPTLYRLYEQPHDAQHVFTLTMSPGVQAYDFTFG